MRALPLNIGTIHFVGIGGIGMSGIAEILHNLNYKVQGSDLNENANVKRLEGLGIKVFLGHKEENVSDASVVVISSAVSGNNPEVTAARTLMIPVVRRAEMLAELMRLKWAIAVGGTHGKTTTTSMIAALLDAGGVDPTVINGGIINAYGTNARLGDGDWMVVEADESDGTFIKLPATIAVVTNIDPEHLDFYGSFDALRKAFEAFIENLPFYGFAAMCIDHGEVQSLIPKVGDRRIITYGLSPQAEIRAINIDTDSSGSVFDIVFADRSNGSKRTLKGVRLPMAGDHNIQNALAAVVVAREMNFSDEVIRNGLAKFSGVKRRFTRTGIAHGITVIDDYAHHPVEIAAALKAARAVCASGKVIAVVQPHRYSRLLNLFEEFCTCFNDADTVIVADVYSAGEEPIEGIDKNGLIEGLRTHGHRDIIGLASPQELAGCIMENAQSGDLVICMGAGTITNWACDLPCDLKRLPAQNHDRTARASS